MVNIIRLLRALRFDGGRFLVDVTGVSKFLDVSVVFLV